MQRFAKLLRSTGSKASFYGTTQSRPALVALPGLKIA
jgi:hypothetical protein